MNVIKARKKPVEVEVLLYDRKVAENEYKS